MTQEKLPPLAAPAPSRWRWRQWFWFGAGAGIEIAGDHLVVAAVQLRPSAVRLLGIERIERFRERPAAVWGQEVLAFLSRHGLKGSPVMAVLPATEAVSRTALFPGVRGADLAAAVEWQLEGLHPYGEGAAVAWMPLGPAGAVLVGAAKRETMERYQALLAEAGVPVAGFTTAPAAIRAALQFHPPRGEFLAVAERGGERWLYGESAAAPLFWGVTDAPADRAQALARSQLRLSESEPCSLAELLPGGELAAAAALLAVRPGLVPLNLLPVAQRQVRSRWQWAPTLVLLALLGLLSFALALFPRLEERRLRTALEAETARWETAARRARQWEAERQATLRRAAQLRQFRERTRQDLDALREATRLIEPPGWAGRLDLTRTALALAGEAAQATELLQRFDQSPLFRSSEFVAPLARSRDSQLDTFQLRTQREVP